MADLRVFVSSTCYDLSVVRAQLRVFIRNMGYEPIMSDYEEVLYDPRKHTHTSCIDEVGNCDILVLIIGSRYGGKAMEEAMEKIDFKTLDESGISAITLNDKEGYSITQLEVIKAIENSIPVYTFIDRKVWHDHELYEKNRENGLAEKIIYPSIEKQETAKFIFNFINFVRLRTRGNNIFQFDKSQDIEEILKKQWSGYFQRLLHEQRTNFEEKRRFDNLSEQFEDLKTAMLSSIANDHQKEIAKGTIRYRKMAEFLFSIREITPEYLKTTKDTWEAVLKTAGIEEIREIDRETKNEKLWVKSALIKSDKTYYRCRLHQFEIEDLKKEWDDFIILDDNVRRVILEALFEMKGNAGVVQYNPNSFYDREDQIEYVNDYIMRFSNSKADKIFLENCSEILERNDFDELLRKKISTISEESN